MSVQAISWAWSAPVKKHTDLLVLLALADSANGEDFTCWPSHKFLADKARCSVMTVRRAIERLVDSGLLEIEPRFKGREQTSNLYTLPVGTGVHFDTPVHPSEQTPVHPERTTNRKLTVHKWGKAPDGIDGEAWEEWAQYKRGVPAKATLTKVANFLREYDAETQRQIVGESIRNQWKGLFAPKKKVERIRIPTDDAGILAMCAEYGVYTTGKTAYQLRGELMEKVS